MQHFVRPEGMPPVNGYSHAVVFAGRMVVISGQVPVDEQGGLVGRGNPEAQVRQVFQNLAAGLAATGASMTAQILLCWLKLIALDGDLVRAEPKTLRYRVLNAAARLVRGGRRRRWKIAANWPWAEAITRAWQRITALPDPG